MNMQESEQGSAAKAVEGNRTLPVGGSFDAARSRDEHPAWSHRFRTAELEVATVPLAVLSIGLAVVVMVAALRHEPEALVAKAPGPEPAAELRTLPPWPEPRVDTDAVDLSPESTGVSSAE